MVKKLLAIFVASAMTLGVGAVMPESVSFFGKDIGARAEVYGDFEYEVLNDGTVEIKKYYGDDTDVIVPEEIEWHKVSSIGIFSFSRCNGIESITIPNTVTNIGYNAFQDCTSLTSINIPNSVTSIGDRAFWGCINLTNIELPNSITSLNYAVFSGCKSITSITIPDSVVSIEHSAFCACTKLKNITIPNSVKSINVFAFDACDAIETINVGDKNNYFSAEDGVLYNKNKTELIRCIVSKTNITIPNSVTSIGYCAFEDCKKLTSVTIPNGVISIGDSAFEYCTNIKSINIPNTVTNIGDYAFSGCENLTSIIIPNSVKSIGESAFWGCGKITSVTISNGVTTIGGDAFTGCAGLKSITIPNSVISIGDNAFYACDAIETINVENKNNYYSSEDGVLYNKNKTELIKCPVKKTSITIPSKVTSIGDYAFSGCENLTSIIIPNSVEYIDDCAFSGCESLTSIAIPNSVLTIGSGVFAGCSGLKSITMPNKITNIGGWAFSECTDLKSINIPNSVTSIGDYAFSGCESLEKITIPKSVTSIGDEAFALCDDLTIKCYSGSAVEKYAKENNIKYEIISDTLHTHSYTTKIVKPTYDAQGYTLHTCSCGDSYKDNYKAKLTRTSIAKATVSGLKSKYYTGKAITQTPVVKLGTKTLKAGTDYTVSYKNNKAIGTATVTITGKGAYTGSVKATFKICPKKTAIKKLTSPKTKQLKVTYNKVAGVTGYQVTYSTSSKFTKKTTKSVNVSGTSKTIKKLTKGKTYYVKVRTYKTVNGTKYYSGYSAVKKIKVK